MSSINQQLNFNAETVLESSIRPKELAFEMDIVKIKNIFCDAKKQNRDVLLEPEGLAVLESIGIPIPKYIFLKTHEDPAKVKLEIFSTDRLVVKVVSSEILHKTDIGAIKIIPNTQSSLKNTIESFLKKFENHNINGFTIHEYVPYEKFLGSEILISIRWTEDYGFVITYGMGGIYTEFMSKDFQSDQAITVFSPKLIKENELPNILNKVPITKLVTQNLRGQKPKIKINKIIDIFDKIILFCKQLEPCEISEFEINPLAIYQDNLIALDILCKLNSKKLKEKDLINQARPINKIKFLLNPNSIGIIGVSQNMNPGHIIVQNSLAFGFDKKRIFVIKPNFDEIEGCKCYESIASLPQKLDLLIFCLPSAKFPKILTEVVKHQKAESIVVIAGGFEEKKGTEDLMSSINKTLTEVRQTDWQGPIINGGNCLGICSPFSNYNTFFLPDYKLPFTKGQIKPLAIIAQSGGVACSRASQLSHMRPKYIISAGNQIDLTMGDYLTYLKEDQSIKVFAIYVEGFKPQDGYAFLKAAQEIIDSGRNIIFYCAGRTEAGAKTSVSHTASIAGDYLIAKNLAQNIGITIADTFTDFDKLIELFVLFHQYPLTGKKLAAISTSGFINIGLADNMKTLEFSQLSDSTKNQLKTLFVRQKIDKIVDINNPVDLTGSIDDSGYVSAAKIVINDHNVDVAILGMVPMLITFNSLPPSPEHEENVFRVDSLAMQLLNLKQEINKPFIVVIDSGYPYNTMAHLLETGGIPVFRTAEQVTKLLDIVCQSK